MNTNVADYKPYNFVDGEGVRCSLYVSGCFFNCKGCYNKCAQNFNYGTPYTDELTQQILTDLSASYCQGLSLLGGEPFLHTDTLIALCRKVREQYGHTKDIWVWTGYTWEELLTESKDKRELLTYIDILIDGRFVLEELDLSLQFRGSRNQRIIDVPASLAHQSVVIWPQLVR